MDSVHFYQLYTFSKLQISKARRMAAQGDKDNARDILRFIRNAGICEILCLYEGPLKIDVPHMQWELRELEAECHPSHRGSSRNDDSNVAHKLDLMAGQVAGLTTVIIDLLKHVKRLPITERNGLSAQETQGLSTNVIQLRDSAQQEFAILEASPALATGGFAGGAK